MQEISSSSPPVVTGICDWNKSWARYHRSYRVLIKEYIYHALSRRNLFRHTIAVKNCLQIAGENLIPTFFLIFFPISSSTSFFFLFTFLSTLKKTIKKGYSNREWNWYTRLKLTCTHDLFTSIIKRSKLHKILLFCIWI